MNLGVIPLPTLAMDIQLFLVQQVQFNRFTRVGETLEFEYPPTIRKIGYIQAISDCYSGQRCLIVCTNAFYAGHAQMLYEEWLDRYHSLGFDDQFVSNPRHTLVPFEMDDYVIGPS